MIIKEAGIIYDIPLPIYAILENARDQAKRLKQTISVVQFYDALPYKLQKQIKKTYESQ